MREPVDWMWMAKATLPFYGWDLDRVVWQTDVRQIIAIAHLEMGDPGESVWSREKASIERRLLAQKMKDLV